METNVLYIDEFRRERWLQRLEAARAAGESVLVFGVEQPVLAEVIPFPTPDGAA